MLRWGFLVPITHEDTHPPMQPWPSSWRLVLKASLDQRSASRTVIAREIGYM